MLQSMSLSDFLGYASIGCWLGAQFPQVIENIRRQSCEGLALPFLANWLLGDISNLVGCIMTHQLPFQTWLATYFVCVDFMLVVQYMYYYKSTKIPSTPFGHIRSATSPAVHRRMSIDRGASRYRALSVAASNVAAAAALAAQQDEQGGTRRSNSRFANKTNWSRAHEVPSSAGMDQREEECEGNPPSTMVDSFHSERGRDYKPKQVSWSIERHHGRASSVGQGRRSTTPTVLEIVSSEHVVPANNSGTMHSEAQPSHDPTMLDSTESLMPGTSTRSSRASRKGSNMVFLAVWALFGIGTLTGGRRGLPSDSLTKIGRVLSTRGHLENPIPIAFDGNGIYAKQVDEQDLSALAIEMPLPTPIRRQPEDVPLPEEPSQQQVIGRIFAWLCTTLYLTSRLPQIWKNYARKSVEGLSMYLFVFAFLGNTFYVSSLLVAPRRYLPPPESIKYIKESIPYLLGSGGVLLFDITIVAQSFCYRPRPRRHNSVAHSRTIDEEEAGLLSGDALSPHLPGDSAILNRGRASRTRSAG